MPILRLRLLLPAVPSYPLSILISSRGRRVLLQVCAVAAPGPQRLALGAVQSVYCAGPGAAGLALRGDLPDEPAADAAACFAARGPGQRPGATETRHAAAAAGAAVAGEHLLHRERQRMPARYTPEILTPPACSALTQPCSPLRGRHRGPQRAGGAARGTETFELALLFCRSSSQSVR